MYPTDRICCLSTLLKNKKIKKKWYPSYFFFSDLSDCLSSFVQRLTSKKRSKNFFPSFSSDVSEDYSFYTEANNKKIKNFERTHFKSRP